MSLRVCLDCTTAFSVGAPRCPHCGSERHADQDQAAALGIVHGTPVDIDKEDGSMPKITRHEGASIAPVDETAETEGGEDVSAGSSSETSSEKPSTTPAPSGKTRRRPARTTASPSPQDQTDQESSSAGGATTAGPETAAAE